MKFFKFKKGNIPITILVIGIFAVCSLALFTFFISDFETSNSFVGVDILHKVNSMRDEYQFYKNSGVPDNILLGIFQLKDEGGQKYFYAEEKSSNFFGGDEFISFSVRAPIPSKRRP